MKVFQKNFKKINQARERLQKLYLENSTSFQDYDYDYENEKFSFVLFILLYN